MNKRFPIRFYIFISIAIIIAIFIIVNAFIPGSQSKEESDFVSEICRSIINLFNPNAINSENFASFSSLIRKMVGHFLLFAVEGCFVLLAFDFLFKSPYKKVLLCLVVGLSLAFISEIVQGFIPGRVNNSIDFLIDSFGYALGEITIIIFLVGKRDIKLIR